MADLTAEKRHAPTPRRRERARAEGQVARSQDLSSAVLLMAAIASLWMLGGDAAAHLAGTMSEGLSQPQIEAFTVADATNQMMRNGARFAVAAVPVMVAMFITGILINVTQTGFLLLPNKVTPSLENISPANNVQRIVSWASVGRLIFGLMKVSLVVVVAYAAICYYGERVLHLGGMEVPTISRVLFESLMGTCVWIASALFALAILDYGFQRWRHERELMMTDEELREELRETEADPAVKRRRNDVRSGSDQRKPDISAADVVITSQSEIAIAIKYNPITMDAPIVIAKGRGLDASAIMRIAQRNSITTIQNNLLAEHQFRSAAIGREIEPDQYQAVAQILRLLPAAV